MKDLLQFPAELINHKTYATKANVSIVFELQENLISDELAKLLSAKGKTGWLVFNPNESKLEVEDIPVEPVHETEKKSKSQRLRATMFVWWKSEGQPGDFPNFYDAKMEQLIDFVKAKLPE